MWLIVHEDNDPCGERKVDSIWDDKERALKRIANYPLNPDEFLTLIEIAVNDPRLEGHRGVLMNNADGKKSLRDFKREQLEFLNTAMMQKWRTAND